MKQQVRWGRELGGAFTASVVSLPLALAFGAAAFAPLGPAYAAAGAQAGLVGAIITSAVAALLGGTPGQVSGPTGPMTVIFAASVTRFAALPLEEAGALTPGRVVTLACVCSLLGGGVQVLLGLARVGRVVRHIPYPVIAGFMNGIALLILLGQLPGLLSAEAGAKLGAVLSGDAPLHAPTMLVGAVTVASILGSRKLARRLPSALVGLLVGSAAYYGLRAAIGGGPVVGHVPAVLPTPAQVGPMLGLLSDGTLTACLPHVVGPALSLGILGSIDSLLTAVVADVVTKTHHDSRRELIGQGVANATAGLFGALPGAGTTVVTLVNVGAGARTRYSGALHGLILLVVMLVAGPVAGGIPMAVLAGILAVTALQLVDGWSRHLLWKVSQHVEQKREVFTDLGVVALVMGVTVTVDLMIAVAAGSVISLLVFVARMGRPIVHAIQRGDHVHSLRQRSPEQAALLADHGARIAVLCLEGPLFFATSHRLVAQIEELALEVDLFILDMQRVSELDSTGAKALQQIHGALQEQGKELAIANVEPGSPSWRFLGDMGDIELIGEDHFFSDGDAALEWAENRLLEQLGTPPSPPPPVPLDEVPLVRGLDPVQCTKLQGLLEVRRFEAGDLIIAQGDSSQDLYVLLDGLCSVRVRRAGSQRLERLAVIAPGGSFGEIALLDGLPRTADVWADTKVLTVCLTREAFERLLASEPVIAGILLSNLAREMARRLRATDQRGQGGLVATPVPEREEGVAA